MKSPGPVTIVIPMAGLGSRFVSAGYRDPKPLIDVFGRTMIEAVIENLRPAGDARFVFVCQREHFERYGLATVFQRSLGDSWSAVKLDGLTEGAACTVLAADGEIGGSSGMVVANADQIVDGGLTAFLEFAVEADLDGLVMSFPATSPKWSYARVDDLGWVREIAEKRVISRHATVGVYYFRDGATYRDAATQMIAKGLRVNGEFYVAPVYNEVIAGGGRVRLFEVSANAMHGIGTPEDLEAYCALRGGYVSSSAPVR